MQLLKEPLMEFLEETLVEFLKEFLVEFPKNFLVEFTEDPSDAIPGLILGRIPRGISGERPN